MIRQGTPGVFFDRDGTIIYDVGYPKRPEQVKLILGVEKALAEIKQRGFQLIMVSNQSGVGRGILNSAAKRWTKWVVSSSKSEMRSLRGVR